MSGDRRKTGARVKKATPEGRELVDDLVTWMSRLPVTEGPRAGERLQLMPWQVDFLGGAFSPDVRTASLSIGRGAGKTTFLAAIASAVLAGPLKGPGRSEVMIVAASALQARSLWIHARGFLGHGVKLGIIRAAEHPTASLRDTRDGSVIRVRAASARVLHGAAPALILLDEAAQWRRTQRDAILAACLTSLGKVEGGKVLACGTRSPEPDHWFRSWERPAPGHFPMVFAADDEDVDVLDPRQWEAANPSLPFMPTLRKEYELMSRRAAANPDEGASFRALRLNLAIPDTVEALVCSVSEWAGVEVEQLPARGGGTVWGVDLGSGAAMSAVSSVWASGRTETVGFFGSRPGLVERGRLDGCGTEYQVMADRGELVVLPGRVPKVEAIFQAAADRFGGPPARIAADRWRAGEVEDALGALGWRRVQVEWRGQGYKDGGEDVRTFRAALLRQEFTVSESRLLRAAIRDARTISDPAGNAKLAKGKERGRPSSARDDALASLILAVASASRDRPARRPSLRLRIA